MGVAASVYAAATPLAIALSLIVLAFLLVRRAERNGGSFEIAWKAVAIHIKYSSAPDGISEPAEPQGQPAPPEATTASIPQPADGTAQPSPGGGGP